MPLSSVVGAQSIVKPGVCTSSTRPASPFEGQMIYETDTDAVKVWDGSAWVGAVNAASLNGVGATSIAYTPTWTAATTNPVLGNGVLTGKYMRVNKLVMASIFLQIGSTTTMGSGVYYFSFPVSASTPTNYGPINGNGLFYDANVTGGYNLQPAGVANASIFRVLAFSNSTQTLSPMSNTVPVTPATGDEIYLNIIYEAA